MSPQFALQNNVNKFWFDSVITGFAKIVCRSRKLSVIAKNKMEGKAYLNDDEAFQNLQKYFQEKGKNLNIHQLFAEDPDRFKKYRYIINLDFSNMSKKACEASY